MKSKKLRKGRKPTRAGARGPNATKQAICFVMAPFGGWNDRYYDEVYKPAVQAAGLVPKRADDLYRPSAIVHDIWAYVRKSQVMLADVTGKNPNVFYELGLAHALGKPVVIVTRSMEDVPFDLRALRVIQYDVQDPEWSELLNEKITKSLNEVLDKPEEAVPPPFLSEKKVAKAASVTPVHKALLQMQQNIDRIRAELRTRSDTAIVSGPDEARLILDRYRRVGLPYGEIIRRLTRRGVPQDWVEEQLRSPARPVRKAVRRPAAVAAKVAEPVPREPGAEPKG